MNKQHKRPRILFILKYRHGYDDTDHFTHTPNTVLSSGLYNSANFVREMLLAKGYDTKIVHVVDNNGIDREVTQYNPSIVIIEALWVVPEKFEVLQKLHPDVTWIVRVHSEITFLAREGMAVEWILEYLKYKNVYVAFNSEETFSDFDQIAHAINNKLAEHILYLPNYYPVNRGRDCIPPTPKPNGACLDVACFGALRPLKNQLIQAIASIEYAKKHNLCMKFHINSTRKDNDTAIPVLKNIRNLFSKLNPSRYALVEHAWLERPDFLKLVREMDIGLQVSLSESFNIVTADYASEGIPVVVSPEIRWVPKWFQAQPTSSNEIVCAMERSMAFAKYFPGGDWVRSRLERQVRINAEAWVDVLKALKKP